MLRILSNDFCACFPKKYVISSLAIFPHIEAEMADKRETIKISLVLNSDDTRDLIATREQLIEARGGPVTISETVRHCIRLKGSVSRMKRVAAHD